MAFIFLLLVVLLLLQTGSHVAQTGFKLANEPGVTLYF